MVKIRGSFEGESVKIKKKRGENKESKHFSRESKEKNRQNEYLSEGKDKTKSSKKKK